MFAFLRRRKVKKFREAARARREQEKKDAIQRKLMDEYLNAGDDYAKARRALTMMMINR